MDDQKYIVFKKKDWDAWAARVAGYESPEALDDAVVIRTKDIFAGPVLDTYAGAVQTAIEVIQGTSSELSHSWLEDLEAVRDYFSERAREAQAYQQKRFPKAP